MNCQDIARILDEQEVDGLLAEEQSDVRAHLAACSDCARDWQIHARLSGAKIPAVPAELRAIYSVQVAGVGDAGARRRGRFVVIGALVAVAAAAAMLVVQLTGSAPPSSASVGPTPAELTAAPFFGEALPAASDERTEEAERPATITEQNPVVAAATLAQFRVLLLPPQHDSTDPAAKLAIESFHIALLQALRRMPDVTVEVASGAGSAEEQPINRLTVVNPQFTTLTSGQRMYRSGDGNGGWSGGGSRDGAQRWAVEVMATPATREARSSGFGSFGKISAHLEVDSGGVPGGGFCGSSGMSRTSEFPSNFPGSANMCSSVDQIAARLVEALRQEAEPPANDAAQFVSRLRDISNPDMDRQRALSELLNRVRQGSVVLDAAAIDAIKAYIGSLPPDQRALGLVRLRGVKQPALVVPLLESLQRDSDEKVRLEALSTLAADYSSDSRVRAAMESVARQDASRFVRMAAQWTTSGDAQWHAYVAETLANKGLPATQRVAPALYGMRSIVDPAAFERTLAFMGSTEVTSQMLDIYSELYGEVRAAGEDSRSVRPQEAAIQNVLNLLSRTNPSAALDLQIRSLEDPLPNLALAGQALSTLMERRDDPRVSKLLDDIAAGKSGPALRNSLEMNMIQRQQMSTRPSSGFGQPRPTNATPIPGL